MNALVLSHEAIRELALQILKGGNEKPKIEFKRYLDEQGLAITISAIANTDGDHSNNPLFGMEGLLDDYGMVILGVDDETGEVVGLPEDGPEWMRVGKSDQVGTQLEQKLGKWIRPVPHTDVYVFDEDDGRRWVVVLIAPSPNQPHVFAKNNRKHQQGQWVVRHGKRTELPDDSDHIRIRNKPVVQLRSKIKTLEDRMERRLKRVEKLLSDMAFSQEGGCAAPTPKQEEADDNIITYTHSESPPENAIRATVAPPEVRLEFAVSPSEALRHYLAPLRIQSRNRSIAPSTSLWTAQPSSTSPGPSYPLTKTNSSAPSAPLKKQSSSS